MDHRKKLFTYGKPYDLNRTEDTFLKAVRQNVAFHRDHCKEYKTILDQENFVLSSLDSLGSLYKIPVLPTLFLKKHPLFSIDEKRFAIKATSSGTTGTQSQIGIDRKSLYYGLRMTLTMFSYNHLLSPLPTNYIVLGYEPSAHTQMGAIKSAYGSTHFAPALHREYALKDTGSSYEPNLDGIEKALFSYERQGFPVRFVGFPAYLYFLVKTLKEHKIHLKLNKHSKVMLGGGWKQFSSERIDKKELYALTEETLGIREANFKEFFSAVEHPIAYCDCAQHHFHVPIYSRVIVRDVKTLLPVPMGQEGLLSFVTPLMESVPLVSIVTDDLAILHEGRECGCGIDSPYFELLGRAGVQDIKTCAAGAAEALKGVHL